MANVYLFDLDGTIADFSHRRRHLEGPKKDYDKFYTDCVDDIPINHVIKTMQLLYKAGAIIYIVTGRREETKMETVQWLKKHCVPYNELYMRPIGDRRRDFEIKPGILNHILTKYKKEEIVAIFEDRLQVIDMWKVLGLQVFQIPK